MTFPAARMNSRIKRIIALSAVSDLFGSYEARDDMKDVLKGTIGFTPEENPRSTKSARLSIGRMRSRYLC